MSDWTLLAIILGVYVPAALYGSSRPAWVVWTWQQITCPIRWIGHRIRRDC